MATPAGARPAATVRITVVRALDSRVLHPGDAGCTTNRAAQCPLHNEGQRFLASSQQMPDGFCPGAWADLFGYVLSLESGANFAWVNEPGRVLASCRDGFRPVIFRIERLDSDHRPPGAASS